MGQPAFKIFKNYLTDIQSAKLTKMGTLRKFRQLYEKSDPMVGLIYQVIEKRTVEYGKFFERISFNEFIAETGLSKRKIQYLINELLEKGLVLRASSKINQYRKCHAYSFNWLRLSDSPAIKAEFLKEYNRLREFQEMSELGAPHAPEATDGCTPCTPNNNSHTPTGKKNNHRSAPQAGREGREDEMELKDIITNSERFSDEAVERKAEKARKNAKAKKTITETLVKATWKDTMNKYWDGTFIHPFSNKVECKIAAKLRRDFATPAGEVNIDAGVAFLRWAVQNWALLAADAKTWWKQMYLDEIKETPDPAFFLALYNSALRIYQEEGASNAKQRLLDLHDPDPMVREAAKLRAKGHDEEYIQAAVSRRRKHLEKEDQFAKIRKQAKQWQEAMEYAQKNLYGVYSRAAKNAQQVARQKGTLVPVDTVKKPLVGQTVDGPDGTQYPVEVMLYFKPAEWHDDPKVMQQLQDEAFMEAVAAFEKAKEEFEIQG